MRKLLFLLVAAAVVPGVEAARYYVDNRTGDDGGDGMSAERPFKTLAKAAAMLRPGDVVDVAPGEPYRESLVVTSSGTAENPIVVRGNGAVLTGLEPIPGSAWQDLGGCLFFAPNKACWGALQPQLVDRSGKSLTVASHRTIKSDRAKDLKPGEALWNAEGVWYRAREGEPPAGLGLCGYFRESGVKIANCSHVVVDGIVAERFANDGFNVHGACHDLVFRNVEARWNGDDGFSVHDGAEAQVRGGHFHHNSDGIADVHGSQTSYSDVLVEDNLSFGVGFYGGLRVLRDSVVRNNGGHQIMVLPDADHRGHPWGESPMFSPKVHLVDVKVDGGPRAASALFVGADSTVSVVDCEFRNADVGLRLNGGATHAVGSRVSGCRRARVVREKGAALAGISEQPLETRVSAKADGVTDVTGDIQRTIDCVSAQGGGRVVLPKGDYVVCALELKSGVELHFEDGAALLSVTNLDEYVASGRMNSAVFASGASDVSITGKGLISGRGEFFNREIARKPRFKLRGGWRTLTFEECRNVRVEDVSLRGATSWTFFLKHCDGVTVRRVNLFGHANYCNDGIDIDSRNVLIEDCDIDAEDDAIVFKTHRPDFAVENVVVRNCRLASNSSNIKFGTESLGTFRNVCVSNCTVCCRTPSRTIAPHNFPGEEKGVRTHAISGIEVSAVDGGSIEDVVVSDIEMGEGIDTPLFVRLARRKEPAQGRSSYMKNVTIERVKMKAPACCAIANIVAGVPGMRPQNIVMRDIDLVMMGGGTAKDAAETAIDERERSFPMPSLFKSMLPAYGFYVRHADGVRLENVRVRYADGREERPAVVADDASVELVGCDFMAPKGNPPLETVVRLHGSVPARQL